MKDSDNPIEVVGAIICRDSRILAAKRADHKSQGSLWEFPGGKVEPNESAEEALERELLEEMGLSCEVGAYIGAVEYSYPDLRILLHAFEINAFTGDFTLVDHSEVKWIQLNECDGLDWAKADIPLIEMYRNYRNTSNYYESQGNAYIVKTVNINLREEYDSFLSHLETHSLVLDLGTGSGNAARYFQLKGMTVVASDLSEQICDALRPQEGFRVLNGTFEEALNGRMYNGIWASASLLHLNEWQLKRLIPILGQALFNSGILFVSFKAGKGEEVDGDGRYFCYYEENDLKLLFHDLGGFEVVECRTSLDKLGRSDTYWINMTLRKYVS